MPPKRRDTGTIDLFRDYSPPEPVAAQLDPGMTGGGSLDDREEAAIDAELRGWR